MRVLHDRLPANIVLRPNRQNHWRLLLKISWKLLKVVTENIKPSVVSFFIFFIRMERSRVQQAFYTFLPRISTSGSCRDVQANTFSKAQSWRASKLVSNTVALTLCREILT